MIDYKVYGLIGGILFMLGFYSGYSIKANSADIEKLELQQIALKAENANLIEQLRIEHEHQQAAETVAKQTQEDLADVENRYADAVNELNALQLQYATDAGGNSAALSSDASASGAVSQGGCKCGGENKAAFQRLLERQMILSRDCDINATYLNRLIEWYKGISN